MLTTRQLIETLFKYSIDRLSPVNDYTLVTEPDKKIELPSQLFSDMDILNHVRAGDIIYVVIAASSPEHFRAINDRFRNAGMTEYPVSMDNDGLTNLITYHVTGILPDGGQQSFIQTIHC